MLPKTIRQEAEKILERHYNEPVTIEKAIPVGGGSINSAYRIETPLDSHFLKYNSAERFPGMFEKEAKGLQLMRATRTVYVPELIATGKAGSYAFILMEFLHPGSRRPDFWADFGKKLAGMHQTTNTQFGLDHDNYMGSLQQYNNYHKTWYDFFILERLQPQLHLACEKGYMNKGHVEKFQQLYKELINIIPEEQPALVHGDLYSGNYVVTENGTASIVDPAVAFNHREVDIAMSTMFGVFDNDFYDSYNQHFPMEKGWEERLNIYNLYPLLIHVNLFGMGYLASVERIIRMF
ncbi:MAG: fructosamine kinase family protein [Bacteroidales bacterium]